jgi:hypothetical protein
MTMKSHRDVLIAFALALAASSPARAQTDDDLGRAFEAVMAANASEWRPDPAVNDRRGSHQKAWRQGALRVVVTYSVEASPEAAASALARKIAVLQITAQPMAGFADGSWILAQYNQSGASGIYFRRGPAVVELSAPSERLVRRLSALFLAAVDEAPAKAPGFALLLTN